MMNIVDLSLVRKGREKLALAKMLGENVEYERKCKYILCGKTFMAARKDKDFCCDPHRTASHKLRENEPSSLARLMTRAVEFDAQYHGHPSNPAVKAARDAALRDVHTAIMHELGIVHVEAPVEAPVVVAPVEAPVVVAPVEAPVVVAPVEVPVEPAPVEAPVEVPVPVQAVEVPVEAHVEPAPVEAPVEPAPVEAPVEPAPVELENDATPDPVDADRVRNKLRAFIAETGFSQKKIARLAGTNQPMISQFLSGKTDGSSAFRTSIWDVVTQDHGLDRR